MAVRDGPRFGSRQRYHRRVQTHSQPQPFSYPRITGIRRTERESISIPVVKMLIMPDALFTCFRIYFEMVQSQCYFQLYLDSLFDDAVSTLCFNTACFCNKTELLLYYIIIDTQFNYLFGNHGVENHVICKRSYYWMQNFSVYCVYVY